MIKELFRLERFPSHIAITDNKVAVNRYMKINNQSIYNGKLNTFSRAVAIANMHKYINSQIKEVTVIERPIQLVIRINTVYNHDCIKRNKVGNITWKPYKEDFEPSWDEDNLRVIWEKCIKDCMTKARYWGDDTVKICRGVDSLVQFVDHLDDMCIVVGYKEL